MIHSSTMAYILTSNCRRSKSRFWRKSSHACVPISKKFQRSTSNKRDGIWMFTILCDIVLSLTNNVKRILRFDLGAKIASQLIVIYGLGNISFLRQRRAIWCERRSEHKISPQTMEGGDNELSRIPRSHHSSSKLEIATANTLLANGKGE